MWRDETLYQIWTQSINPWRNYCDFSVWPNDLEHCVACCARLWDNFHQVWPLTPYPCLNYSVFLMLKRLSARSLCTYFPYLLYTPSKFKHWHGRIKNIYFIARPNTRSYSTLGNKTRYLSQLAHNSDFLCARVCSTDPVRR